MHPMHAAVLPTFILVIATTVAAGVALCYLFTPADSLDPVVVTAKLMHRPMQQSWDQENLHNLGHGTRRPCPAVFDAPDGNLRQCL